MKRCEPRPTTSEWNDSAAAGEISETAGAQTSSPLLSVETSLTRQAIGLAIGSLFLAGCFSLLLIIGRLPTFAAWITDPLLFKRCLVLHVDLALIVWFFAFAAGLYALLPGNRRAHATFRFGFALATSGVLAMIAGTLVPGTVPVLANYVPVIDNSAYVGGIALFFAGLSLCFLNNRLFVTTTDATPGEPAAPWSPFRLTPDVAIALKTAALAYLVAMTTFVVSWAATPPHLPPPIHYEVVFWGGGHVLQVANVAAMLAVWLLLLGSLLKQQILSSRLARVLFALLLAPHLLAPLLTWNSTVAPLYRLGFTRLMQFAIAPVVLIVLGICVARLRQAGRTDAHSALQWRDPRLVGFLISAALTLTGFVLGSAIRDVNTMIPAHYHASIGAVTAAFMAATYPLLALLRLPVEGAQWRRWIPWQLYFFGGGQVVFAIGFGVGGLFGLSRKAYGTDQYVRSAGEWIGLGVMGMGGLIAVIGGLLFLLLVLRALRPPFALLAGAFRVTPRKFKPKPLARSTV